MDKRKNKDNCVNDSVLLKYVQGEKLMLNSLNLLTNQNFKQKNLYLKSNVIQTAKLIMMMIKIGNRHSE